MTQIKKYHWFKPFWNKGQTFENTINLFSTHAHVPKWRRRTTRAKITGKWFQKEGSGEGRVTRASKSLTSYLTVKHHENKFYEFFLLQLPFYLHTLQNKNNSQEGNRSFRPKSIRPINSESFRFGSETTLSCLSWGETDLGPVIQQEETLTSRPKAG